MRKSYLIFIISLTIIACSGGDKVPAGILPPKKMQEVLWDMISAGEMLNGYLLTKDSVDRTEESAKEYGQVLQFHHITMEQFNKSYLWYRQHPAVMKVVLDTLSKRQVPPEEHYKPKSDTTKIDTAKMDSTKIDSLRIDSIRNDSIRSKKELLRRRADSISHGLRRPEIFKRDSTRKKIRKKLRLAPKSAA